jgi:hypothetical protein
VAAGRGVGLALDELSALHARVRAEGLGALAEEDRRAYVDVREALRGMVRASADGGRRWEAVYAATGQPDDPAVAELIDSDPDVGRLRLPELEAVVAEGFRGPDAIREAARRRRARLAALPRPALRRLPCRARPVRRTHARTPRRARAPTRSGARSDPPPADDDAEHGLRRHLELALDRGGAAS